MGQLKFLKHIVNKHNTH